LLVKLIEKKLLLVSIKTITLVISKYKLSASTATINIVKRVSYGRETSSAIAAEKVSGGFY